MIHLRDMKWLSRKGAASGEAIAIKSQQTVSGFVDRQGFDRALIVYYHGSAATNGRIRVKHASGSTVLFASGTNLSATRLSSAGSDNASTGLTNIDLDDVVTSGSNAFDVDLRPLKRYLRIQISASAAVIHGAIVILSNGDAVPPATTGFNSLTTV